MRADGREIYIARRQCKNSKKSNNLKGVNTSTLSPTLLVMRHSARSLKLKIEPSIHLVGNQLALLLSQTYV